MLSKKKTRPKEDPSQALCSQSCVRERSRRSPAPSAPQAPPGGSTSRGQGAGLSPQQLRTSPAALPRLPGGRAGPPAARQPRNPHKPRASAPSQRSEAGTGARENGSSATAAFHRSRSARGRPSHPGHGRRARCPRSPAEPTHPDRAAPAPRPRRLRGALCCQGRRS